MKQCTVCFREYNKQKVFCPYDGNLLVLIDSVDPHIGSTIDYKYQINYKIAEGGMGNVYHATHLQLSIPVAVKIMHSKLISDQTAIERFRREAQAAMKIHHTNAIATMDFGVSRDSTVYLVMEYLSGCTLRHRLKEVGHLEIAEANRILQQICAALNVAHRRKIIHRDLKPENIFLQQEAEEEIVKVLDFGIAKLKDQTGSLTRQGMVVGTPLYMSPEQCLGAEIDLRSDIYSIGVLAYEMLSGKVPFEGPSSIALAIKQTSERPRPIYEIKPEIPIAFNAVVMRALEKSPENRQQTVLDFAREFEIALDSISYAQAEPVDQDKTERLPNPPTDELPTEITTDLDERPARHTGFDDAISTGSDRSLDSNTSEDSESLDISREMIKDRKPIWVPATEEITYAVTCEKCGEEVGRSVIPNATIICPTCRTKMRDSGRLD